MDEPIELFLEGCKLAKFLEANIRDMANNPELLSRSCDEIIRVFSKVKENISKARVGAVPEPHGIQELLRSSQIPLPDDAKLKGIVRRGSGGLEEMVVGQMGSRGGGRTEIEPPPAVEAASSGGGRASSSQRQGRRRGGGNRRAMRVPAPRMGNTEIPPEDGYTWRKYGQKIILNSRFPRSYFRCTHKRLYDCPAKKQVQRMENDPNIFEVTYLGNHTCHLSSTAPSALPPPSMSEPLRPPTATTSTAPISQWLSMDISTMHGDDFGLAEVAAAAGGAVGSTSRNVINLASASTSRGYGRDVVIDYQQLPAVADMADAMFNSGSGNNNDMDLIFSSMDVKWQPDSSGDKKI
ncbi:hypothetical protein ACH5RR_019470 [Cinchona calisaya]|uniref:WRKY domain-containing protein n=1 Tax=Cinchona calisaya TaxID=153742 RepID=A0ABD2ZR61_9GENT